MRSELPICSFAAFILVLFPLPRQWRARNIATITAILWIAITNLIHGINSIIWSGNVEVKFLVWCDISTKITLGSGFASPAAGFCIVYNLAKLASIDPSRRELYKRDRTIRDIIICVLLPLVYVLLHYIVQDHRFDIAEDFGCTPAVYFSWLSILLISLPPLILGLMAAFYSLLAIRSFLRRRKEWNEILSLTQTGLTTPRYLRLLGIALSSIMCNFGFTLLALTLDFREWRPRVYASWSYVHSDWPRIGQFPKATTPASYWTAIQGAWMMPPVCALFFFAFLGSEKKLWRIILGG